MNRRTFIKGLKKAGLLVAAAICAWPALSFITWRRDAERLVVFAPEEQVGHFYKDGVYLIVTESGIAALSARCTHLCCIVDYDEQDRVFRCPCHRSVFDTQGKRVQGPAREDLPRLPVRRLPDGGIEVRV
jgi:cytochrome b6-f complex iron-sulfur subunit